MRGAGGGRPSKGDAAVNRHRPTQGDVMLPAEGRQGPPPEPLVRLKVAARRVWDAAWSTPAATQWTDEDVGPLTRLVSMQADPLAWKDPRLLAEMRQLEDRYGMNPYARRNMHWRSEGDEPAKTELASVAPMRFRAVDPATG